MKQEKKITFENHSLELSKAKTQHLCRSKFDPLATICLNGESEYKKGPVPKKKKEISKTETLSIFSLIVCFLYGEPFTELFF